jgi:general secretion pathway protein N
VWNGSAQLVLSGGQGSQDRAQVPGLLHWRLQPGLTQWRLDLTPDCCSAQAIRLVLSPGIGSLHVTVQDHQSRWPAALLSALGAPWNTLGLDASLNLQTHQLTLEWAKGRTQLQGDINIKALNASSRLATLRPLGSYETVIRGGKTPTLTLSTLEGSLLLSGQGQWTGNRLRFAGEASASAQTEAVLNNLLNIIGRRQGSRSLITLG